MARSLHLDHDHEDGDVVAVFPTMAAARSFLERTAEWAMSLLDDLDGDTDIEGQDAKRGTVDPDIEGDSTGGDPDREPCLGWNANVSQLGLTAHEDGERSLGWQNEGSQRRLHAESQGEECEPSLGSLGGTALGSGQGNWSGGARDDREEENEHGSDDDAGEPSLGWTTSGAYGTSDDGERDAGDEREEENEHGGDIQDEPHDGELDLAEGGDLGGVDNGLGDAGGRDEQAGIGLRYQTVLENRQAARHARDAAEELGWRKGKHARRGTGICNVTGLDGRPFRVETLR